MSSKLILLRHGQSAWNLENKFTGWTDVDLTDNGILEAENAARLLLLHSYDINLVYTSLLKRANRTMDICLKKMKLNNIKKKYDWRLNERHYGSLQGLNKSDTALKYGNKQVLTWRRSFHEPPPPLNENDPRHPKYDPLYRKIDPQILPSSESLEDTIFRILPLWNNFIIKAIKSGKKIMIVAHGNSLRAIVKILDELSDGDIVNLNIPTGSPLVYEFNDNFQVLNSYYLHNL